MTLWDRTKWTLIVGLFLAIALYFQGSIKTFDWIIIGILVGLLGWAFVEKE